MMQALDRRLFRTVLVVDDEMLICLDVQMQLEEVGHRVLIASSVAEATQIIDRERIDFAVVDWHLGSQSAADIAAALRLKNVPFMLCTGSTREELEALFPNVPLLTKPFVSDQLLDAIDVAVAGAAH